MRSLLYLLTAIIFGMTQLFAPFETSAQNITTPGGGKTLSAKSWMVSTASTYASQAGQEIIKSGGNAIDAMVAIQLVLGLVEPNASGLGGGSFLVYWDAKNSRIRTYDGRETAPALTSENLFTPGSEPFASIPILGPRFVGVPGTLKLLETVHRDHGQLPWKNLFGPAIRLAKSGFKITQLLNSHIAESSEFIFENSTTRKYFLSEEAVPLFPGTTVINTAYAKTLEKIARDGSAAFYDGEIAAAMVNLVAGAPQRAGALTLQDFQNYDIIERPPLCVDYRAHQICGLGGPASGAATLAQILKLVEPFNMADYGPFNPLSWRLIAEASRLAFADRDRLMGDIESEELTDKQLDAAYLTKRAELIATNGPILNRKNTLPGIENLLGDSNAIELPSGSHFSIVDREGNMVSMTSSLGNNFGSILMTHGFLLNNALTDFSTGPRSDSKMVANAVAGGKRPLSSMSPTIVLKDGKPIAVLGSTGDRSIIIQIARSIIALIDWRMEIQQILELPIGIFREDAYLLQSANEGLVPALKAMGYDTIISRYLDSGQHAITISTEGAEGLTGGADFLRDGLVLGGD